jgi:hypothetical protein
VRGARVYGIFEQLFDSRCRALYHLTGSDLVSYSIGKEFYFVCHKKGGKDSQEM